MAQASVEAPLDVKGTPSRLRAGWKIVAAKELQDHVRSVRFTILIFIMGLSVIAAVYSAANGIREVAGSSDDFPALFLKLFTVSPERVPPFFVMIGWLGPLLGIAFGFDAVNGERSQGTLPRLLSQPIYRDDVINGKFVAGIGSIGLALLSLMLIVSGVGIFRIGITPTVDEILRLIVWLIVAMFYIGFWLALSTLFSVVLRKAATSALASIATWLVATLFAGLLVGFVSDAIRPLPDQPTGEEVLANARTEQLLSRVFPGTLYEEATIALLTPERRTFDFLGSLILRAPEVRAIPSVLSLQQSLLLVWPQITVLVALTVLCFIGAYISFMRQEVRA